MNELIHGQRFWQVVYFTTQKMARTPTRGCDTLKYQYGVLGYTSPNPWPNKYKHYCLARWVFLHVTCSPSCPSCDVSTRSPTLTTTHYRIHFSVLLIGFTFSATDDSHGLSFGDPVDHWNCQEDCPSANTVTITAPAAVAHSWLVSVPADLL